MLLSTKFHRPLSLGRLTERPRLDARLDQGLASGCPLFLVVAPAGFGKSTLVSAWLRKQKTPSSWLSLDSGDNDPGQFLGYLVGALQTIDPNLGSTQTNRIQTAAMADSEAVYADVLKTLINEIATHPAEFLFVLDDCHLLKNPAVLNLLNFLVENQPAPLRLILISREDLPLPILRVRRQLVEVRQPHLQFTPLEAEDFLREGMGIRGLTVTDILALDQRTEGWVAGLQLAGLSIRSESDPARFIRNFAGSDRMILDYFMEEVFTRQPEDVRNFLLASSLLERFCAPLCNAVLAGLYEEAVGTQFSQNLLERLEHANLFLIPLDDQRKWYRYHHLFSELLRHSLSQVAPQKIPSLQRHASRWLEENGFIPEAVQHAFRTGDWDYAADMVERHAWNMILHSQVSIVSDWCQSFPEAVIGRRPALCVFHGWALIIAFKKVDFPAADIRIRQAQAALHEIDPQAQIALLPGTQPINLLAWVTGHLTLLRSFILMASSRRQADPKELVKLGELSYDQLPPEDVTGRSVGLLDVSYASQALSDAADAEKKFEKAMNVALSGGNYFGAVVAEYHRAHGLFSQGKLRETIAFCEEKRATYEAFFERPLQELPAIALLDQAQGCALLELNELEQAEHFLRKGLEVGQWMPREELPGYLALARLCALKGDEEGMAESWRRLDMRWPDIRYCTEAMRVAHRLFANPEETEARQKASVWAEANIPAVGGGIVVPGIGPAFFDEADHAVFAAWIKIQIVLGNSGEALKVVSPMLEAANEHQLLHRVIELSLLEAQAFFSGGQRERAWKSLRLALSHAETNGYLALVDGSPVLASMLMEAVQDGIAPDLIGRLLNVRHRFQPR